MKKSVWTLQKKGSYQGCYTATIWGDFCVLCKDVYGKWVVNADHQYLTTRCATLRQAKHEAEILAYCTYENLCPKRVKGRLVACKTQCVTRTRLIPQTTTYLRYNKVPVPEPQYAL